MRRETHRNLELDALDTCVIDTTVYLAAAYIETKHL